MTGNFKDDLNDDLDGLTDAQIGEIFNWRKFYEETYTHVGVVEGRFYDSKGQKTQALVDAEQREKNDLQVVQTPEFVPKMDIRLNFVLFFY